MRTGPVAAGSYVGGSARSLAHSVGWFAIVAIIAAWCDRAHAQAETTTPPDAVDSGVTGVDAARSIDEEASDPQGTQAVPDVEVTRRTIAVDPLDPNASRDIVRLRDGSFYRGVIVELIRGEYVIIRAGSGTTVRIAHEDIEYAGPDIVSDVRASDRERTPSTEIVDRFAPPRAGDLWIVGFGFGGWVGLSRLSGGAQGGFELSYHFEFPMMLRLSVHPLLGGSGEEGFAGQFLSTVYIGLDLPGFAVLVGFQYGVFDSGYFRWSTGAELRFRIGAVDGIHGEIGLSTNDSIFFDAMPLIPELRFRVPLNGSGLSLEIDGRIGPYFGQAMAGVRIPLGRPRGHGSAFIIPQLGALGLEARYTGSDLYIGPATLLSFELRH